METTDQHFLNKREHPIIDESTFRSLFNRYWKRLLSFCQHHIANEEAAMDIVQEIFCSLWKRREDLSITVSMEYYLFRAVRLKINDYYREKYKHQEQEAQVSSIFCEAVHNTEETVLYHDLDRFIGTLLQQLPDRCREVYTLSRIQGLNIKEIALELHISEKTVEAHLTKSLKFLKGQLDPVHY